MVLTRGFPTLHSSKTSLTRPPSSCRPRSRELSSRHLPNFIRFQCKFYINFYALVPSRDSRFFLRFFIPARAISLLFISNHANWKRSSAPWYWLCWTVKAVVLKKWSRNERKNKEITLSPISFLFNRGWIPLDLTRVQRSNILLQGRYALEFLFSYRRVYSWTWCIFLCVILGVLWWLCLVAMLLAQLAMLLRHHRTHWPDSVSSLHESVWISNESSSASCICV